MVFIQNLSQQEGSPPLHLLAPQATNLSSMGSMIGLGTWYPVDDIIVGTPCHLHILLNKVGNKTKEVAIGVVMSGRVFHNNLILTEYAMVLFREITDMQYTDYPLDHVTPEGVKELGQVVNQIILWNQREIFLDGPISPQKQCIQLSKTPTSSPAEHVLATPSGQQATQQLPSPHIEQEAPQQSLQSSSKDKEASQQPLLSSPTPKVKEALQLPSPPTETEALKDKEASPV
jgi:hypothetical protein